MKGTGDRENPAFREWRPGVGVVVTMDLIGIGRELSLEIRRAIGKRHGLELSQIALCTSHTHSGPVVGRNLMAMYFLSAEHVKLVAEYSASVREKVVKVVDDAFGSMRPAVLSYVTGKATFAVNRRNNSAGAVVGLRKAGKLRGPVDHDVPVLRVADGDGKLRAVLFGSRRAAMTGSSFSSSVWNAGLPRIFCFWMDYKGCLGRLLIGILRFC